MWSIHNRLYITWRFLRGVESQFQSLRLGVDDVVPLHLLRHFDERELDVSSIVVVIIIIKFL